jgi:hypothetical protein
VKTVAVTVALVALAAAGCGGAAHDTAPPAPPKLPRALAQSWAQQADAIASALAAGDGCTAETRAVALRTEVVAAANDERISRRLLRPLTGAVNDLPDRIPCTPVSPPPPHGPKHPPKDEHRDKHDKHRGGGH